MARRSGRIGFMRPEREIERLRSAREMLTELHSVYPINGETYRRASDAMDAIDALAKLLVGDREYFWQKTEASRARGGE